MPQNAGAAMSYEVEPSAACVPRAIPATYSSVYQERNWGVSQLTHWVKVLPVKLDKSGSHMVEAEKPELSCDLRTRAMCAHTLNKQTNKQI